MQSLVDEGLKGEGIRGLGIKGLRDIRFHFPVFSFPFVKRPLRTLYTLETFRTLLNGAPSHP